MSTIGIDIGGSKALAVRLEDGVVAQERHTAAPGEPPLETALAAINGVWSDDVEAVGVGIAGLVRWPEGVFAWGPHVDSTDLPIRELLEERLGIPVVVDNDATVAAYGDHVAGAAQDLD
ncbi:MAG: ROK family protein, partial [Phycisphaeraceae bacterium]|nr:ROK family protein [Phycisphaeraceae bacterium]